MGRDIELAAPSPLLTLYRTTGYLLAPALTLLLERRTKRGKEDRSRRAERFGIASHKRPDGSLIWVHAASVGETYAALPVIREMTGRGLNVLLTTGTVTSAQIARNQLPEGAFHQYVPFDIEPYVKPFLDTWAPDLVLLVESEIWPLTLAELGWRSVPVLIVNAKMSPRSASHWRRATGFSRQVFANVDLCLAQSRQDADLFAGLGVRSALTTGNLKFDREPPAVDDEALRTMKAIVGDRPVWIAASTHAGEEAIALAAHRQILQRAPDSLLIVAPRHPQRGDQVADLIARAGLSCAVRSKAQMPNPDAAVYLADTIGDLGLLYRLSDVAFVGGSFADRGGQNPVEPAQLGIAVVHGPNVRNFKDIYKDLDDVQGALRCETEPEFHNAIESLLFDTGKRQALARHAGTYVTSQRGSLARTMSALDPYLQKVLRQTGDRAQR